MSDWERCGGLVLAGEHRYCQADDLEAKNLICQRFARCWVRRVGTTDPLKWRAICFQHADILRSEEKASS